MHNPACWPVSKSRILGKETVFALGTSAPERPPQGLGRETKGTPQRPTRLRSLTGDAIRLTNPAHAFESQPGIYPIESRRAGAWPVTRPKAEPPIPAVCAAQGSDTGAARAVEMHPRMQARPYATRRSRRTGPCRSTAL
jgi:hypothetical protein